MDTPQQNARTQMARQLTSLLDSNMFKTLGEPVRVQLLEFLIIHGRSDIAQISASFSQDRSVISRHLNAMLSVGLLVSDKESRHVFYAVDSKGLRDKFQTIASEINRCMSVCCPE